MCDVFWTEDPLPMSPDAKMVRVKYTRHRSVLDTRAGDPSNVRTVKALAATVQNRPNPVRLRVPYRPPVEERE